MEFFHDHMEDRHDQKERNKGESTRGGSTLLKAKAAELKKLKEKLKKAKDDAEQSWLDSKPLIDELEKLQSELASMNKSQAIISGTTISDLDSQIQEIGISIRFKKEEELKIQTAIDGMNQELNSAREEIEQLEIERDENHRTISHTKKVLRLKNQSLQALQLTVRAIRLETEAYGASAAEANRYVNCSHERSETLIKLTQQDYKALVKRSREETTFAEWRISVAMEQKDAAEEKRNASKRRLQNLLYSRKRKAQNGLGYQTNAPEVEEYCPYSDEKEEEEEEEDHAAKNGQKSFRRNQPEQNAKKSNGVSLKKKRSLFSRLRIFLLQKIRRYLK